MVIFYPKRKEKTRITTQERVGFLSWVVIPGTLSYSHLQGFTSLGL